MYVYITIKQIQTEADEVICYSEFHGGGRSSGRNDNKLNGTLTYNMYSFRGEGSWCLVVHREVLTGCVSFIGFAPKSA